MVRFIQRCVGSETTTKRLSARRAFLLSEIRLKTSDGVRAGGSVSARARASFAMEALNKIRDAVDNTIREQARKQARRQVAGASLADPVSSIPRRPAFLFPSADPS